MADPKLFVGLGGTGATVLLHLKKRLIRYHGQETVNSSYAFLMLDSDESELERLKITFQEEIQSNPNFLQEGVEFLSIGGFVPSVEYMAYLGAKSISKLRPYQRNMSYWIDDRAASQFPENKITIGLQANRQLGRFALMLNHRDLENRLVAALARLSSARDATGKEIQVYVVTSSCGGTGSSTFYDTLFLIDRKYKAQFGGAAPRIRPVIFAPFHYIDNINAWKLPKEMVTRYRCNAWAFFTELDYGFWDTFQNMDTARRGKAITQDCCDPESNDVMTYAQTQRWRPFEGAFIIDARLEDGRTIPERSYFPHVAQAIYYIVTAAGQQRVDAILTNDAETAGKPDDTYQESFRVYFTVGYRALEYPRQFFRKYFLTRFKYDVVNLGLLRPLRIANTEMLKDAQQKCREIVYSFLNELEQVLENTFKGEDKRGLEEPLDFAIFCKPPKPGRPLEVDVERLDDSNLTSAIDDVKKQAQGLRDRVISMFQLRAGNARTDTRNSETGYEMVRDGLSRLMREGLRKYGVRYLAGDDEVQPANEGILSLMDKELTNEYKRVADLYQKSNTRLQDLLNAADGDEDGLEQLKQKVLEAKKKERQTLAERFNDRRIEYINEVFKNLLLFCKQEFLYMVAAGDEPEIMRIERTKEGQVIAEKPIIDRFEEQARQIAQALTDLRLDLHNEWIIRLPNEFRLTEQDLMTSYLPKLTEYINNDNSWKQDGMLNNSYKQWIVDWDNEASREDVMKKVLEVEQSNPTMGFHIENIASDETKIEQRKAQLLKRLERWVEEKWHTDTRLESMLNSSISEEFKKLSRQDQAEMIRKFKNLLQTMGILMTKADLSEIQVYCAAEGAQPAPESLVAQMGYSDGKSGPVYQQDIDPTRFVALKIRSGLIKENLANFDELRIAYENRNRQYVFPHLSEKWNKFDGPFRERAIVEKAQTDPVEILLRGLLFHYVLQDKDFGLVKQSSPLISELFSRDGEVIYGNVQDSPIFIFIDKSKNKRKIVACKEFSDDWVVENDDYRIRIKTKQISEAYTIDIADEDDRYDQALASIASNEFIGGNIMMFQDRFLDHLKGKIEEADLLAIFGKARQRIEDKFKKLDKDVKLGGRTKRMADRDIAGKMLAYYSRIESELRSS